MNALRSSADNSVEGNVSDSDSSADDSPDYYQPISAEDEDGELGLPDGESSDSDGDDDDFHHSLPNGYASCMENGVLSLDLRDGNDIEEEEGDEDEEDRKREREDSGIAIRMAFTDDESRRSAPLPPENSMRVMEAMRGVSFGGLAPDWAAQIPEDQWINQLRRSLRRPSPTSSGV